MFVAIPPSTACCQAFRQTLAWLSPSRSRRSRPCHRALKACAGRHARGPWALGSYWQRSHSWQAPSPSCGDFAERACRDRAFEARSTTWDPSSTELLQPHLAWSAQRKRRRGTILGLSCVQGQVREGDFDALVVECSLQPLQELASHGPLLQRRHLEAALDDDGAVV